MSALTPSDACTRLAGWLTAKWRDQDVPVTDVSVAQLTAAVGAGYSAETLFAEVRCLRNGHPWQQRIVVRCQNESSDLFLDADLRVPYRMMAALQTHPRIPVPPLIGMELDRDVLGAPFLVMQRMAGRSVEQSPNYNREGWVCNLPVEQRGAVWRNALRALAEIHKLDWRAGFQFLHEPAHGEPGLTRYLHWVEEWYRWARRDRPHPVTDMALDYLKHQRPSLAPVAVLWGDPTPGNVLFNDDLSVNAVIDWEMAALGPPEADVAWWLFFDDLYSTGMGVTRMEGLPDRASSIAWYEACLGRRLENLEYYDVLAAFRMAIVGMRAVDRQIGRGRIPATTTARTHSPIMRMLAARLGEPRPEIGPDFVEFVRALGMH